MPIEAKRCARLALGVGLATAIAYGWNPPLGYLIIVLTAVLMSVPMPPPAPKAAVMLIVLVLLTCGWGLLLGPVLTYVPVAGVLLMLGGVGLASALATRPAAAIVASLLILGSTLVAVVASQSSAAGVAIIQTMLVAIVIAVVLAHVCHAVFPEDGSFAPRPPPPVPPAEAAWIGVRSALIMVVPVLLALSNPGTYIMVLMKGSQLSQQVGATDANVLARELVVSTAWGGAAALAVWYLLGLWSVLPIFVLLMALSALLLARPMYGAIASRHRFTHWQNALVTLVLLIGPAVADSASGTDITRQLLTRIAMFMALAVYAAAMVWLLDGLRAGRRLGVDQRL